MIPVLETTGLTIRFGGVVALSEVDIQIAQGTLHGLIGPNGAGKTTFVDAITGFERPSAGEVRFHGKDVNGQRPHRLARQGLSRTFQSLELYNELTTRENLEAAASAARRGSPEWFDQSVDLLGIRPALDSRIRELPHGQRRLVSIARALVSRPDLLVLDEPAAGLETVETVRLGRMLRQIVEADTTILLIDHDMSLVLEVCDRITVLESGRRLTEGTPAEIAADPSVRSVYLGEAV